MKNQESKSAKSAYKVEKSFFSVLFSKEDYTEYAEQIKVQAGNWNGNLKK